LNAGLVARYGFDESANDSSGNGLHGTLFDGQYASPGASGSGSALLVQGTGYSDLGNPAQLDFSTGDWTVTAWFKTEMTGTGNSNKGTIYGKGGDSGGGHRYALIMSETWEGRVSLVVDNDENKRVADSPNFTNDNEWHFAAGKREGNIVSIIVDGRVDDTATLPEDYEYDLSGAVQYNAYVGALTDNSSKDLFKFFFGSIDDVTVHERALTDAELAWMAGLRTSQHKPF
ncbi:LamG-like jellyroll fold domain-containing protein, partial [Planctomycetota bacterium]